MIDAKHPLSAKIRARISHDRWWASWNLLFTQCLIILAVLASFASSVGIAYGKISTLLLSIIAAIPGCAVAIDRGFNFMKQARWHYLLGAELQALVNALEYEDKSPQEVSARFSKLLLKYQRNAPFLSLSIPASNDSQNDSGTPGQDHELMPPQPPHAPV